METIIIFGAQYLIFAVAAIGGLYIIRQLRQAPRHATWFTVSTLVASFIVSRLAAWLYYNPRPFVVKQITPLVSHAADNGFPSDHTLLAATLAAVVWPLNRRLGAFLFGLAIVVGLARVMAQVHHLIDIAGSVIIAIIVALVIWIIQRLARLFFKFALTKIQAL